MLQQLVVGVVFVLAVPVAIGLVAVVAATAAALMAVPTKAEAGLSQWQRIKRRINLLDFEGFGLHGMYKHPDGTVEWDFEAKAGIDPFVDIEEVKYQKRERYFRRKRERKKAFGGVWVAAGVSLLAWQMNVPAPWAIYGGCLIGYGLWRLSGGESSGDYG
jgi:hypothetical protein